MKTLERVCLDSPRSQAQIDTASHCSFRRLRADEHRARDHPHNELAVQSTACLIRPCHGKREGHIRLQRRCDRRSRCSTQFGLARLALERPLKSRTPSATTSELFLSYRRSNLPRITVTKIADPQMDALRKRTRQAIQPQVTFGLALRPQVTSEGTEPFAASGVPPDMGANMRFGIESVN